MRASGIQVIARVACAACLSAPALAQSTPDAARASAQGHFARGVAAARQGRWAEALQSFSAAYELAPQPDVLLNLAGAQAQTGHVLAAADSYRRFLREPGTASLGRYRPAAVAALAAVQARAAHARIVIADLRADDALTLDAQPLPPRALETALALDPGGHVLVCTRGGAEIARSAFVIAEGEDRLVTLGVPASVGAAAPATHAPAVAHAATSSPAPLRAHAHASLRLAPPPPPARPLVASPWIWVAIGAVTAGAVAAVAIGATAGGTGSLYHGNVPPGSVAVEP